MDFSRDRLLDLGLLLINLVEEQVLESENDRIAFFPQRQSKKRGFEGSSGLEPGNCGHHWIHTTATLSTPTDDKKKHQQSWCERNWGCWYL